MIVLRREVGNALRDRRLMLGRTLRQVAAAATVSLGYLSEIERGKKEASSELLVAICSALDLQLSSLLRDVADRVAAGERRAAPVPLPMHQPTVVPVGRGVGHTVSASAA